MSTHRPRARTWSLKFVCALLLGFALASLAGHAAEAAVRLTRVADPVTLAETPLRGYGRLAGEYTRYRASDGADAARLVVRCEDEVHARLTASKFARDLQAPVAALATTLTPIATAAAATWQVPGQGWLAVRQHGRRVALLAATSVAALDALDAAQDWPAAVLADASVPAYLDAWDRYGFRFYYRPWETPNNQPWATYPVLSEFDFAARNHAGFAFWEQPSETDSSPALSNMPWWDWAARAAARRGLPIVNNTTRGASTWLLNRYRSQVMTPMSAYCGTYHSVAEPSFAGMRMFSWCATSAADAEYALMQRQVQAAAAWPTTIEYMEPNCELKHGDYDIFLEHGPLADVSYRTYLRQRYRTVGAVAERWQVPPAGLRTWDDVRVPEVAAFLGWGPAAVDLTGTWRLAYEPWQPGQEPAAASLQAMHEEELPTQPAPAAWFAPDTDDHDWATIQAPGNDVLMFLPKRPAVWRREFTLDPAWLAADARTWLYVWDLNLGKHEVAWMNAVLNGSEVGRETLRHAQPHWAAFEVTAAVRAGRNVLALRLPKGVLAYRVYLAHHPPLQYPQLAPGDNAQWVDFSDWRRWTRLEMCRRGLEAIRAVDPDRSIICAAPDGYYGDLKRLTETYGAHFHNTGHMGAFWNDYLPMLMRGADQPFSLEPGGPAPDLPDFKHQLGLYFTEGVQAVHYFIHVGNIMWPNEIREHFERIQPLVQTIGKVHPPKAEVAMLLSDRTVNLSGYPWGHDYNVNLPTGYWGWRFSDALASEYHVDAVTDQDFARGNADPYRVIVDTNSAVLDEATVDQLTAWVKRGGIFVTMVQTGRHTPERPDSWPIARLTGYRVTAVDPYRPDGGEGASRKLQVADGQPVFAPDAWDPAANYYANGLSLARVAPECRDLLRWQDGTVAAGLRPLGRGYVLHVGVVFGAGRGGGGGNYLRLLRQLLEWAKVTPLAATAADVTCRHAVSNNGLYDLWTLWNGDHTRAVTTHLEFRPGTQPATLCDVLTGAVVAPGAALTLAPLETRMLISPRQALVSAPLDWYRLQCGWWRGSARPATQPLPLPPTPNDLDLTGDWACRVLPPGTDDQSALAAPELDDHDWPRRPLTCWAVGEELPGARAFFRQTFTVPATWREGELTLWLRSWFHYTVSGTARYWLDGQPVPAGDGRNGLILPLTLAPGSRHCLAVEIRGEGQVCGVRGNTWLHFTPAPRASLDLAGAWATSVDDLRWGAPVTLPGTVAGCTAVRRSVRLPADWHGGAVYLEMRGGHGITGVIINGHYVRRHHHNLGDETFLNLTPLLNSTGDNELLLVLPGGAERRTISTVQLRLYDRDQDL